MQASLCSVVNGKYVFLFLPLQTLDHSIENWLELIVSRQLLFRCYSRACCVRNTSQVNDILLVQSTFDWVVVVVDSFRDLNFSFCLSPPPLLDWMQMDWSASWTFKYSRSGSSVACLCNWFEIYSSFSSLLFSFLPSVCVKRTSKFIISESLQFGGKFYPKTWLALPLPFSALFSQLTQCALGLINETICHNNNNNNKRPSSKFLNYWTNFAVLS